VQLGGSSSLQGRGPLRAEDSRHQHTVPRQSTAGKVSQRCSLQLAARQKDGGLSNPCARDAAPGLRRSSSGRRPLTTGWRPCRTIAGGLRRRLGVSLPFDGSGGCLHASSQRRQTASFVARWLANRALTGRGGDDGLEDGELGASRRHGAGGQLADPARRMRALWMRPGRVQRVGRVAALSSQGQ